MEKRYWDPKKSKWKAAIERGMSVDLKGNENILYLGASTGSTISHLSPRTSGMIYSVEKSNVMAVNLVRLSEKVQNVLPLFCDAHDVDYIKEKIGEERIDILFCDIPSFDQVEILRKASELVKEDCKILFSLKTQSISQERPENVKNRIRDELKKYFKIQGEVNLEPFQKKHFFFILQKK
jgi:fibrillarin-like pre-rRNA processing protein